MLNDKENLKNILKFNENNYIVNPIYFMDMKGSEYILNILQGIISWLIINKPGVVRSQFKSDYSTLIAFNKSVANGDAYASDNVEKINALIKNNLKKNLELFHNLIGASFFDKDLSQKDHFNEIFILKLTSKYKDIGEHLLCVVFEEKAEKIIHKDGTIQTIKLQDFINGYFGMSTGLVKEIRKKLIQSKDTHWDIQSKISEICNKYQNKINEDYSLNYGAVMFCDFLGWKGLWKNSEEKKALNNANALIQKISQHFDELSNKYIPLNKYYPISKIISISDTIALMTPQVGEINRETLFKLFSDIARFILEESIKYYPLRGAITLGEFNYNNNIMMGPAIDEAASWHEMSDWIGIILSPSAQFEYEKLSDSQKSGNIEDVHIPLKVVTKGLKYCIKWQDLNGELDNLIQKTKALTPEIANKYLNTSIYLKSAIKEKEVNNE